MNDQLQGSIDPVGSVVTSGGYQETQADPSKEDESCSTDYNTLSKDSPTVAKEFGYFDVGETSKRLECEKCNQKYVKAKITSCGHTGI